ncbi:hypothetical protein ACIBSW_27420 [Actinoplanes sp. NPDC049668]|uniref:hypothetical protein n=1 Tax=unclassified Actinoplanes TaxID=2626549 RepID=UPI0033BEF4A7
MPDQLEALFADLRAETLPRVRPPGAEAARHTVRRRRARTRNAAAATVALAVAGGLIATRLPQTEERPAERLTDLVASARRALEDQLPKLAGRLTTGVVTGHRRLTFADLRPGGYTLAVTCAGSGTVTIDIEQVRSSEEPRVLGVQTVSCGRTPAVAIMTFRLTKTGPVAISASGDAGAAGSAGYALELGDGDGASDYLPGSDVLHSDDAVASDESAENSGRAADMLTTGHELTPLRVTTEQMRARREVSYLPPGKFELRIVCAGPGTLNLLVAAVPPGGVVSGEHYALMSRHTPCQEATPLTVHADVLSLPNSQSLVIIAVPDPAARNRAGWAFQVSPAL